MHVVWLAGCRGQTVGKRLLGLRTIRDPALAERGALTAQDVLWDYLGRALFFLDVPVLLWRSDRKGLHNTLSGTVVVVWDTTLESRV